MAINDDMFNALRADGFLGTLQDMYKAWLASEGLSGGSQELYDFYVSKGVDRGTMQGMSKDFSLKYAILSQLTSNGETHYGNINT